MLFQQGQKKERGDILMRAMDMSWWRVRKPVIGRQCNDLMSHKSLYLGHPWERLYHRIPVVQWPNAGKQMNTFLVTWLFPILSPNSGGTKSMRFKTNYLVFGIKMKECVMNLIPFISFTAWIPYSLKIRVSSPTLHAWCMVCHETFLSSTDVWFFFLLCTCYVPGASSFIT